MNKQVKLPAGQAKPQVGPWRMLALCLGAAATFVCSFKVIRSVFVSSPPAPPAAVKEADITVNLASVLPIYHDLNDAKHWKLSPEAPLASAPALPAWGSWRPGYYFGLSNRDISPLATGITWSGADKSKFRHATEQDELTRFDWLRHDGRRYGAEQLVDGKNNLTIAAAFIVPEEGPTWMQRFSFSSDGDGDGALPFVFYMGADCPTSSSCSAAAFSSLEVTHTDSMLRIAGRVHGEGFQLTVHLLRGAGQLTYAGLQAQGVLQMAKLIAEGHKASSAQSPLVNAFGDLSNALPPSSSANSLAVQLLGQLQDAELLVTYSTHPSGTTSVEDSSAVWNRLEAQYVQQFDAMFLRRFPRSSDHEEHEEAAKICLSSMLGGMGYFAGQPAIANGLDIATNATVDAYVESAQLSLFTATPSRTAFPRGFLWDEGFHEILISKWDMSLTLNVLQAWMNCLHVFDDGQQDAALGTVGWMPREMILGPDAASRVPGEFIDQRVNIANPPTLLMVIDSLLDVLSSNEVCSASSADSEDCQLVASALRTLADLYPRLLAWLNGFYTTQSGQDKGSFRWRGRSLSDNKNIPNTLASGLDDYPRGLFPSAEEKHLDLHCWVLKATLIMDRLQKHLVQAGFPLSAAAQAMVKQMKLENKIELLYSTLDDYHWSEEHQGFFDTGVNNESAVFVAEVMFRCGNQESRQAIDGFVPVQVVQAQQSFCPPSFPQAVGPVGDPNGGYRMRERLHADNFTLEVIPRVGYVALFPLLLKLLPPSSHRLAPLLDMIEDPALLWTDYGLRSLATIDKFYQRRNAAQDAPYWR